MPDHIDHAIDDTARALSAGEPDAAFRARIVARLEEGGRSHRAWWIGAPIAAAALIAIALVFFSARERTSPGEVRPDVARGEAPAAPRTQTSTPAVDASTSPERAAEQTPRQTRLRTRAANAASVKESTPRGEGIRERRAAEDAGGPSPVTQLAPPPLEVPSIAVAPIDGGPSLQLDQLAPIAPIAVAPLENETAREPQNQNREP